MALKQTFNKANHMNPHPHAKLAQQFWEEMAQDDQAWRNWECRYEGSKWEKCSAYIGWNADAEYRRKPRTININGHEVPEPCRVPLELGTQYFVPYVGSGHADCQIFAYGGVELQEKHLAAGLVHLTPEAAILHAKALLSLTRVNSLPPCR